MSLAQQVTSLEKQLQREKALSREKDATIKQVRYIPHVAPIFLILILRCLCMLLILHLILSSFFFSSLISIKGLKKGQQGNKPLLLQDTTTTTHMVVTLEKT